MLPPVVIVRWGVLVGVWLWFVVYWSAGFRLVADVRSAIREGESQLDTALMGTIILMSVAMTLTGLLVAVGLENCLWQSEPVTFTGAGLTLLGIVGTFYCRRCLGEFWTAEAALLPGHRIVDRGPYGLVRHPIYTFALLLYVGFALVFPTCWNLVSVVVVVMAYALKAQHEDDFLNRELEGYGDYRRRVRYRLVPGIW